MKNNNDLSASFSSLNLSNQTYIVALRAPIEREYRQTSFILENPTFNLTLHFVNEPSTSEITQVQLAPPLDESPLPLGLIGLCLL